MRASTLFAITLSMLLGLGAAAGARYAGLFDKKETPPPEAAKPAPMILAARANLFEGLAVSHDMTEVRPLNQAEAQDYFANPNKYMPASTLSAHQRIAKRTVPAGTPLLKEYFEELELQSAVGTRVDPGTTMVNVPVVKEMAAGGVLRVGDYVDVVLSTRVSLPGNPDSIRTGVVARQAKVVMKRNTLTPYLANDPAGKPIWFGLQLNPYRAALVDYALSQKRGDFSLRVVPASAKKPGLGAWSDPTSAEYADEDQRVEAVSKSEYVVSDADIARVLKITPPVPGPQPIKVENVSGVSQTGGWVFPGNATGQTVAPRQAGGTAGPSGTAGVTLTPPSQPGPNDAQPGCKNCKK